MKKTLPVLLICLALLISAGCLRSKTPKFYLLQPIEEAGRLQPAASPLSLGVGPVEIPDYLRRAQIARRTAGNEIFYSDAHRWAEPLDTGLLRVLAENLSLLLDMKEIAVFPWLPSAAPACQVQVRIVSFDGSPNGVQLVAYWSIVAPLENKDRASGKSVILEKPESGSAGALVQAQNHALEKLSREIAAQLQKLDPPAVNR